MTNTRAAIGKDITVNLSTGEKTAFNSNTITLKADENNQIWLPDTLNEMVTINVPENNKVDSETFYFSNDWQTNETVYAYSFTGWKVKGTGKNIPMETVYQPGDYIDVDTINGDTLELIALWGKTIFIQNKYNTMVYNQYAILDETASEATGLTGADDLNTGRKVDKAVATIDYVYTLFDVDNVNYDPYKNVVMLVGNLDYIKSNSTATSQPDFDKGYQSAFWGYGVEGKNTASEATKNAKHVTFKSLLNKNENYLLKVKPYGYNFSFYGATRFDNVDFVLIRSNEITNHNSSIATISGELMFYGTNTILEFTNRFTNTRKSAFVLRTTTIPNVVVNGGYFSAWQFIYSANYPEGTLERFWKVGKNAEINTLTLGTTSAYETTTNICYGNVYLYVQSGKITNIYGASTGMNTKTIGKRFISIKNGNVTNLYGGGNMGTLYGNIFIDISNSNISNVYGGGYAYTANVYGDIDVKISASTIGNIYGGGYNGNVMKTPEGSIYGTVGAGGNVKVQVENGTKVSGTVFGSGMGGTQTVLVANTTSKLINTGVPEGWENPASDFPKKAEDSDYITVYKYKYTGWTSNSATSITFGTYTANSYLSLATVENVDITISNSSVAGNVYGGGSIATVNENTKISILDGSVITGNVYGGGDGVTKPASVKVYYPIPSVGYVAPSYTVNENGTVTVESESGTYGKYLLGTFTWSNDTELLKTNGIDVDRKLIYSPNTVGLGKVAGNTNVIIDNSEIKNNVYAGGNAGSVDGNTNLTISNSILKEVYTGGNNGDVLGDCILLVDSGTMQTVFGGGNLGTVEGNTHVTVGNANNNLITISNVLYGGGRGTSATFETVKGTATVIIEGLNTKVANYGSSKLGKVVGDVDVTFKNYWTGNTTDKYRIMNGIDRATNVRFDNSYVLLENKDETGNLVGIKDITNLFIPAGSGLKVSAPGEIAGDFNGGGTFYLDSEVCLTIRGNITGSSVLVLNPKITADGNIIKGSKTYPYMRVYGKDLSASNALYSSDSRYVILKDTESTGATIYYIAEDIIITEKLENTILNAAEKHYTDDIATWKQEDCYIVNDEAFSTNCNIEIEFADTVGEKYKNVTRKLVLYTGDAIAELPVGTNIVMIKDGVFYKYRVNSKMPEISLASFNEMDDSTKSYKETTNVKAAASLIGGNELNKTYQYAENFRFVVDFAECASEDLLLTAPYNLMMTYYDNGSPLIDLSSKALNVIRIEAIRKYQIDAALDRDFYMTNGIVTFDLTTKSNYYALEEDGVYDLMAMISVKDKNGNIQKLSEAMKTLVDGVEKNHTNSNLIYTVVSNLSKNAFNKTNEIKLDMSKVSLEELWPVGAYEIVIDYYLGKDDTLQNKVFTATMPLNVIQYDNYSFYAEVYSSDGKTKLELLNVNKNTNPNRNIEINYLGDIIEPYIEIKLQKKNGTEFAEITNSVTVSKFTNLVSGGKNEIQADFSKGIDAGTYKLVLILRDKYAEELVKEALEFNVN